jgi:hypothetical protein
MNPAPSNGPRPISLGRLFYLGYHRPRKHLRECRRLGLRAYWNRLTGDARMRRAAAAFGPLNLPPAPARWPGCRFLTGRLHWQQAVFCARSLEWALGHRLRCEFFDDGTMDQTLATRLRRLFPDCVVQLDAESHARLCERLPPQKYPSLHDARRRHVLVRKLLDLHAAPRATAWNLTLDGDMLFLAHPDELRDWFNHPATHHFLHDATESLFAPETDALARADGPILRHFNSGLLAMDDQLLDWDRLEAFAARCTPAERGNRWFEQSLTAYHFAGIDATRLDPARYRVIYDEFTTPPSGVLIHYCWHSNLCYKAGEWRRIPTHAPQTSP